MKSFSPTRAVITWRVYYQDPRLAWFHESIKSFSAEAPARAFLKSLNPVFVARVEEHNQPTR